jgi:alkylation response protein AidB-like acyl-CoA dehydrogenase
MYFGLTFKEEGWATRTAAAMAQFAAEHRTEFDEASRTASFPHDLYREMGRRGWVGPLTPVADGGSGGGVAEYCLIEEEVGRHRMVSPQISIQGQCWLIAWGTAEQRARLLRPIASGEAIFSESISEPGVGSSLKLMRTTAVRSNGDWVINGTKCHVNLGHQCDVTIVYAKAREGLTAFLVDRNTAGVSTRQTDPIGLRMIPTADVHFDDVRVPESAVLGTPGGGMETFLATFNTSRLGNASELIGWSRRALAEAIAYGQHREVGAGMVTDFQGIQWIVADCYGELYGAALARDRAATLADTDAEHALETTLAKKLAVDAAERCINQAFALVGAHGLYTDTDFGALLHDMKVLRVAGGSLEVLRNYAARRVLRDPAATGL